MQEVALRTITCTLAFPRIKLNATRIFRLNDCQTPSWDSLVPSLLQATTPVVSKSLETYADCLSLTPSTLEFAPHLYHYTTPPLRYRLGPRLLSYHYHTILCLLVALAGPRQRSLSPPLIHQNRPPEAAVTLRNDRVRPSPM